MTDETASNPGTARGEQPTGIGPTVHDPGPEPGPGTEASTGTVRPPLRRSVSDRKVAGICGGLGRHLDVDPIIFRVLFAVFAVFGGASLLLYGLGWLLLPAEDQEQSDAQRLFSGRGDAAALLGVATTVLGFALFVGFLSGGWDGGVVLLLLALIAVAIAWAQNRGKRQPASGWPAESWIPPGSRSAPPWWQQPGPPGPPGQPAPPGPPGTAAYAGAPPGGIPPEAGSYPYPYTPPPARPRRPPSPLGWIVVSVALIVAGGLVATGMAGVEGITAQVVLATVLIVVGAGLVVGTWFGRARSLIGLGSVVAVALVTISTYSVPLRGGFGDRAWTPTTPATVESPYRLTGGRADLDVTQLDPQGGTVKIEASVVFGELYVLADDDVRLVIRARSGMGTVVLPDGTSDGVPAERNHIVDAVSGDSKGTIELVLRSGMGKVEVRRVAA